MPQPIPQAKVWSLDPRTGERRAEVAVESDTAAVDRAVTAAHQALPALADRLVRARLLLAAADALAKAGDELVNTADAETALGSARLTGELARTAGQLRAFATVAREGALLDVVIDHPATPGAGPVLRRWLTPIGVVGVFAASNFPLAFSVLGGDTASALAAGCPVVVKAHADHPATAELAARLLHAAAREVGVPAAVLGLVHGFAAGVDLVRHPALRAVGFTGSLRGGRALSDLAAARPRPIPFHGELGSLNPVVVTERAADERAAEIGTGLAGSVTLGAGQFCTKPGLVLVPAGPAGDRLAAATAAALAEVPAGVPLDGRIGAAYLAGCQARAALPGVASLTAVPDAEAPGRRLRPCCLELPAALLIEAEPEPDAGAGAGAGAATGAGAGNADHTLLLEECFGPLVVLARYRDAAEAAAVLARVEGSLTATLHTTPHEPEAAHWLPSLAAIAGRVLVGGWPTGVAVLPAMHHGGPYPASTSNSTSVGATAVERWLRPVVYQDAPPELLPPELHDANPLRVPRRVDGQLERPNA
ncbi:aldehyde dehydrogenase family protein [Kitasatospora sp. GAS1066B]|uniref:aldehyde dehydrogenase family protein n=1 Tax=Kitasatospora sp. GAS1066B TaxID=3156271 RepID=UPI003510E887